LMADAAADLEAIRFESAMHRFDSVRTATSDDAEAHRQYARLAHYFDRQAAAAEAWERVLELEPEDAAAWDEYFTALRWAGAYETDRRYGEKLMQALTEALRHASGRPELYTNAQDVASDLGQLEAYVATLTAHRETHAGNRVFQHHLGAAQVALAGLEEGDRSRMLEDSIRTVLDELAERNRDVTDIEAPVLYQLAAGYELLSDRAQSAFIGSGGEGDPGPWQKLLADKDFWLARLLAAPDRGILADDMRYWDLVSQLATLQYGPSASESMDEQFRIIDEGLQSPGLGRRAAWISRRLAAVRAVADESVADDPVEGEEPVSMAAEPRNPGLAPQHAEALFEATMEYITWQNGSPVSSLRRLLDYGIRPQRVLEEAVAFEEAMRADRPGYIYAGSLGEARERARQSLITSARGVQARALAQLGQTEAAGRLFQELATESPGSGTLAQYGRHLMRTGQPERGLDMLVEALAHGGSWRRTAEEAAEAAGLPVEVVAERLAVRQPTVQAELEAQALGDRLEREPPDLALPDQHGTQWALRDLSGKVVVLKFWATWCGPCLEEFPHFVQLLEKYEGDDEVVFLTVASAGSSRDGVAQLLATNGYTFPVLLDDEGRAVDFEVLAWPTTFYLDPDGLIQYRREGFEEDGYEHQTAIRIDALRAGGP
ncbi:MAG: redoxin domain-containing protein, partial [Gemmatimonadetes bacterium]|nr:redoxin domain-containing protein [Gemmatimonadota bacterium]